MMKDHLSFFILFRLNKHSRQNDKPAIYLRLNVGNQSSQQRLILFV